jgi:hypothetical protein
VVSLIALSISLCGCVERVVRIKTEPTGALVFLNDEEVGRTPLSAPFTWYGDYDVVIRKEGYRTLQTHRRTPRPWYQYVPIDFVVETLVPFTLRDEHLWEYELAPYEPANEAELVRRAVGLRSRALGAETETAPADTSEVEGEGAWGEPASESESP